MLRRVGNATFESNLQRRKVGLFGIVVVARPVVDIDGGCVVLWWLKISGCGDRQGLCPHPHLVAAETAAAAGGVVGLGLEIDRVGSECSWSWKNNLLARALVVRIVESMVCDLALVVGGFHEASSIDLYLSNGYANAESRDHVNTWELLLLVLDLSSQPSTHPLGHRYRRAAYN